MDSELRQDIVSGDWVAIAPARAKKPEQFLKKEERVKAPIENCPFEDPQKSGNSPPALIYANGKKHIFIDKEFPGYQGDLKNWQVQILENKYPALKRKTSCAKEFKKGPYAVVEGVGYHDLVIARDHDKNFANLDKDTANLVFTAFKDRYSIISKDNCTSYTSIFHNWGPRAGASVYHPHYQIISLPIIPPDIGRSLKGSDSYFFVNKKCVHCVMIEWEKKDKARVVYENAGAIAFTPFVSREPFEVRIFPKKHLPFFEETEKEDTEAVVDVLQKVLKGIEIKLKDPDYNFFIHTAPHVDKQKHGHYHWHIEIVPQISISAGFELGTGIEITAVDPDEAAAILRIDDR